MMSSCHREDQGERPPGVWNALFFPVVFRKAVINLIPSSSLHAPGVWGKGGRERGQEEEEMRGIANGWGTLIAFQKKKRETDERQRIVRAPWLLFSIPTLSDVNEANYPGRLQGHINLSE